LLGSTSRGGATSIEEDTFGIRSVLAFQEISVQLRDLIGKTQIGIELLIAWSPGKQCKEIKKLTERDPRCRALDDRLALSLHVRGDLASLDPPGSLNPLASRGIAPTRPVGS
jgi:hypothetical protein